MVPGRHRTGRAPACNRPGTFRKRPHTGPGDTSPHRWDPDGLCQRPGPHAAWGRSQHSGWSHGPGCPGPRGARAALSGETSLTLLFIHSISKERSTILLRSDNRKRLTQALVLSRDGTSLREKQFGPWGAEGGGGGATGHTQSLGEGTSQGTHGRPGGRGRPQRAAPPGQASRTGTLARPRGRCAGRVMRPSPFRPGRAGDPPPPQSFRGAAPHSWAGRPPAASAGTAHSGSVSLSTRLGS